jgi:hypothetical protein
MPVRVAMHGRVARINHQPSGGIAPLPRLNQTRRRFMVCVSGSGIDLGGDPATERLQPRAMPGYQFGPSTPQKQMKIRVIGIGIAVVEVAA